MFDKDKYTVKKVSSDKWEVTKKGSDSSNPLLGLALVCFIIYGIYYVVSKLLGVYNDFLLDIFGRKGTGFIYLIGFFILCGIVAKAIMDSSSDIPHDKDKSDIF